MSEFAAQFDLAVTTWIYGLARRWASRGVTANVLDPGMVKGKFGEQFEAPAPIRIVMNHVFPLFLAVDTERGSQQYVGLSAHDPDEYERLRRITHQTPLSNGDAIQSQGDVSVQTCS